MNAMNEVTGKPTLTYMMKTFHNIETRELYRRAAPVSTGVVGLDELCDAIAADGTYGAIRASLVKNVALGLFAKAKACVCAGKTVVFDDYFRCRGWFSGGMDPVSGKPTKDTLYRARMIPLTNMLIPVSEFDLVCSESDIQSPAITSITSSGLKVEKDTLVKGKDVCIAGRNLYYDAAQGDALTVGYVVQGEMQSLAITPTDLDSVCFRLKWPAALDEVPAGTELTFTLSTRCGVEDGAVVKAVRKAVLAAG